MLEGAERDGVFETEEAIHIVEATVSRAKDTAKDNIKKIKGLIKHFQQQKPEKAVKGWLITKSEPTADQREVAIPHAPAISALGFDQFQSRLIDATTYLNLRDNYPYGSVRDPATGSFNTNFDSYVPLDVVQKRSDKVWSVKELRDSILAGDRFLVLGDYGAGKSSTLREINKELRQAFFKKTTHKFPIYLNLRDHLGQINPAEVLERHGRNLGFQSPHHLVRAWRAGYAVLLLDGFDELTTLGIQGLWKRLQDSRYRAMQVVRELIKGQPDGCGIALAGRAHFFNSERELQNALTTTRFVELALNEFTDDQLQRYLHKVGALGGIPAWMPSRPLLVGYLAATGLLKDVAAREDAQKEPMDPGYGWNLILNRVCTREADIEAGIDGGTVRRILERLATSVRASADGRGPLSSVQIVSAFAEVCGYEPDEKGMLLLQRLPGLGIERAEEGTRAFIDSDFADACRAGDVVDFFEHPFEQLSQGLRGAQIGLGSLGVLVAARIADLKGLAGRKLVSALDRLSQLDNAEMLTLDCLRVAIERGCSIERELTLTSIYAPSLELSEGIPDISKLVFKDCYFSKIELDPEANSQHLPKFVACYIGEIEGRSSASDLPVGMLDEQCSTDKFSEATATTRAIGELDLPLGVKVLLTVLKKIYLQSGSGRKENALQRGLDHHARRLVPAILRLLQREGLISPYKRAGLDMTIWVPDRANTPRVAKLIAAPHTSDDPLLKKVEDLAG